MDGKEQQRQRMLQAAEARRSQMLLQGSNSGLHEPAENTSSKWVSKQPHRDRNAAESSRGPSLETEHHEEDPSWLLAMKMQADFDAEDAQAREAASATWQSPYHEKYTAISRPVEEYGATSRSAGSTVDTDEEMARRLQAMFYEEAAADNVYVPPDSYKPDTSSTPVQLPTAPTRSASTGAGDINISTSSASLQSFAQRLARTRCAACKSELMGQEFNFADLFIKWMTGKVPLSSAVRCTTCSALTCIGCNTVPRGSPMGHIVAKGITLSWCCDAGKEFTIWVLLCCFDQERAIRQAHHDLQSLHRLQGRRGHSWGNIGGGVGYGGGYGGEENVQNFLSHRYGQHGHLRQRFNTWSEQAFPDSTEPITKEATALLAELLPSIERNTSFDRQPPQSLLAMITCSAILDKTAELLRNDSIDDITKRSELYDSVVDFVQAAASHPSTAAAINTERRARPQGAELVKISREAQAVVSGMMNSAEKLPSIASCLQNLITQSKMILQSAENNRHEYNSHDGKESLRLCRKILGLSRVLVTPAPNSNVGKGKAKMQGTEWEQYHKETCIEEVADNIMSAEHFYARDAARIHHTPEGRMKRLIEEIANMKTSLPTGVFVRHASSRPDIMKALIVGPSGTPYEGGLFEFDILCPANYPVQPLKVHFRTNYGARIMFNPNLHPDGRVCLSLLNTWPGQPWQPNQSTLLQVLVSIQAMIFCENPLSNEPGWESMARSLESAAYNQRVQVLTVQYAMLPWLRRNRPQHLWTPVVTMHFKTHAESIVAVVNRWARCAPARQARGTHGPTISALAAQLSEALHSYPERQGAQQVVPERYYMSGAL